MDRKLSHDDVQKFSHGEGERFAELSPCEQELFSHMSQWKNSREPDFYRVIDSSDNELLQGPDARAQELPQWPDIEDQKLSRRQEHVSSQELSQWRKDIAVQASPTEQNIDWEMLGEVLQEVQALKLELLALQQVLAGDESVDTAKNEESSVLSPHSTPSLWPAQLSSQAPREQQEEGAASASVRAVQESEDGTLTGEDKDWEDDIDSELSQWENKEQAEVSHREMNNSQEVSQGQECPEQEPCSQGPAPAPHSPPSPWPARLGAQALRGQPAAPGKRPSRFRRALRALRGLFCCSCLRPRTEE
nr:uncharacterized protein LOC115497075 [Taeniopygia guttata]